MEKIPRTDKGKRKTLCHSMSKKSLSLISIVIVLVGCFIVFKEFSLPRFVSNRLTDMMKVYVSLGDLNLGLKDITAEELTIMNPKGFHLPKAMSIEKISISTPFTAFFRDEVVIDELRLDNIYVGLEFENQSNKKGNWTVIMKNLGDAAPKGNESSSNKYVKVTKCILTNLNVQLAYTSGNPAPKFYPTIAYLEINNIDSRNGLPLQEISNAILQATLQQIFSQENIKNMLETYLIKPNLPFSIPFLP